MIVDITIHKNHKKFSNDSIHHEDDMFILQTDGVFLGVPGKNKDSIVEYLLSSYSLKGESFVRDLRGSFLLYLFDKTAGKHLIYTNHIGDKRIYYFHHRETILVSTSMKHIATLLKSKKISYSLDNNSAYYMLTYGYMFNDSTMISEIKRMAPGHYIRLNKGVFEIKPYFILRNTPDFRGSDQDALERVDELFRNAISMEFEKDLEYGYTPLCSLSGGLDSRMTTWVGHEMGYTGMTSFTFARTGSLDMIIPEKIVQKLDHKWIFKTLDEAGFMCNVDDIIQLTGGTSSFLHLSHGKFAIDSLDFSELGLLHTGQLGDVTLGSYLTIDDYGKPQFRKAVSSQFLHKLPVKDLEGYENLELQLYMNRGLNYILNGNRPIQEYSEVISPFLDVDFLEFCMSLPLKYRVNHVLYKKWILQKYPGAAEFIWERLNRRITAKTLNIRGKSIAYTNLPEFVIQGIKYHVGSSKKGQKGENRGMNPFQFWYDSNKTVHNYIEQYYMDHLDLVTDPVLKIDCEDLFTRGNISEKTQVLSLLATLKLFWD